MKEYANMTRENLLTEIKDLKNQLLLLQNRPPNYSPPEHDLIPFIEDHSEIITRLAPDGTILFMNPAGGLYFGTPFEELVAVNIDKIITPHYNKELKYLMTLLSPENTVVNCGKGLPAINESLYYKNWRIRGLFREDALVEVQLVGKDIADQKFFEKILDQTRQNLHTEILRYRQAEQDYYELFDKANEIIYSHDFEGRLLFINDNGEKILGFEPGTLKGRSIYDLIVPQNHQLVREMIKVKLNNEQRTNYELPVQKANGEIRTLELSSRLIYRENQPYAIMGIARDITERKHFEDALQEGEAKFRKLAETSPAFIVVVQGNHYKYVNPHFEKLTGYHQEDLLHMNFWDIIHPDYRDLVRERGLARQQGTCLTFRYEFKINTKNGREIWIDFASDLIEYEGEPAVIGTGYDISSKKELEHALRNSEENFRKLANTAPALIFVIQKYRFRYVNTIFTNVIQYNSYDILELNALDIVHPSFKTLVETNLLKLQSGEISAFRQDIIIFSKSGQEYWMDLSADIIDYEGKPAVIATAYDITSKKELENALRNSEENFRALTDTASALIFVIHRYRYIYVNSMFRAITKFSNHDLGDMNSLDPVHPEFRELVKYNLARIQSGEISIFRHTIKMINKIGQEYWIDFSARAIEFQGKQAIIGTAYDVTDNHKLQVALGNSESSFRQLAETAPALIYVIQGSELVFFNLETERVTGYSREELVNMKNWEFIHPDHRGWVNDLTLARQRGENVPSRYETVILNKKGESIWIEVAVSIINFNNQPASMGVGIDITKRKKAMEQIKFLSYHDRLTGLYNRAFLEEKLKKWDDEKHLPLSIIMGDVNGLKMINDALGHHQGDRLLNMAADSLKSCCRKKDLIARWGGDEFVILLPRTDGKTASEICEKITGIFNGQREFPLQVSISLGAATKTEVQQKMSEISREAEDRMYRNKLLESKSNRSTFIRSLEKTLWTRSHETQNHTGRLRKLVSEIGNALELDSSEINNLTLLAALHDIGKIAIPNSILDKKDKLTVDEWEMMKKHPEIGYRIAMSSPELTAIAECILTHHERWDGNGYPLGLEETNIPLLSRILAIADAYDVMLHGRPYQEKITVDEALQEIHRCAGTQFDPSLARLFIKLIRKDKLIMPSEAG